MNKKKTQDQLDQECLEKAMGEGRLQHLKISDLEEEESLEWRVAKRGPDGTPSEWERDVRGTWTQYFAVKGK